MICCFNFLALHFGQLYFFLSYSEIERIMLKDFLHFSQYNSYVGMLHLLFLGDIPHNDRIDTIFMLVSNYLITGELATVTLRYIENIVEKSELSNLRYLTNITETAQLQISSFSHVKSRRFPF